MDCQKHCWFLFIILIVVFSLFNLPVLADEFPSKPITLICPFSAGGSTDALFRALSESTAKYLGQRIIVANKPGGTGTIGPSTMAATAKPDGYTISQLPQPLWRFPHMMEVTWDPMKDFSYIIHIAGYTIGVVVRADAPWKTFNEFVAYAKANPNKVTYAAQANSTPQLAIAKFARKEGIIWRNVPGKGDADTVSAVLGGHVDAGVDSPGWAPLVDAGQLRLLVTFGNQRTKRWPDVPTCKELGYGLVSNSAFGIGGPKGMDPKVVKILHDAIKKGMEEEEFQKIADRFNFDINYMNTQDYIKFTQQLYKDGKEEAEILLGK